MSVSQLRLNLSPAERTRLTKHHTEQSRRPTTYYLKGVATFSSTGSASPSVVGYLESGLELLERAVADRSQLRPRPRAARLGRPRSSRSITGDKATLARARASLARADALDPNLAESHVARAQLLWSSFSNYDILGAFEALKAAQAANPNIGHPELGMLYAHVGMPDDAKREVDRAIELDPTSDRLRTEIVNVSLG